ncbi:EamA family transporter [Candidatus Woesearchaeota archaeon]|nr:EamA family transporter [Candidatus Woesearchaeota archaeon]
MNSYIKGSMFIILAMLLFSIQSVFVRFISLPLMQLLAVVFVLQFVVMLAIVIRDRNLLKFPQPIKLYPLIILSALGNIALTFSALRLTSFANAMFSHYTMPVFVLILSVFFLKEKFHWKSLVAIVISMAGLALLFQFGAISQKDVWGIWLGLGSALAYAVNLTVYKAYVAKNPLLRLMFYTNLGLAVLALPFLPRVIPSLVDFGLMAYLAVVGGVIAVLLFLKGLKIVLAQHAGIIAYIEIVFTVFFGFLIFQETLHMLSFLGGLLIIGSGIWIIREGAKTI